MFVASIFLDIVNQSGQCLTSTSATVLVDSTICASNCDRRASEDISLVLLDSFSGCSRKVSIILLNHFPPASLSLLSIFRTFLETSECFPFPFFSMSLEDWFILILIIRAAWSLGESLNFCLMLVTKHNWVLRIRK